MKYRSYSKIRHFGKVEKFRAWLLPDYDILGSGGPIDLKLSQNAFTMVSRTYTEFEAHNSSRKAYTYWNTRKYLKKTSIAISRKLSIVSKALCQILKLIQESEHKILCSTKLSGADNLNFIKTAGFWNNFKRWNLINLKLGVDVFFIGLHHYNKFQKDLMTQFWDTTDHNANCCKNISLCFKRYTSFQFHLRYRPETLGLYKIL